MHKSTEQTITYGIHDTCLGDVIIAESSKGICWLGFMTSREQGAYKGDGFERMKKHFPTASFVRDHQKTRKVTDMIIEAWEHDKHYDRPLDLQGSDFECQVWKALLDIPRGQVVSYGKIANDVGKPKASRAVGTAVGKNPISLVIPCHRVVKADGSLGNYGWGLSLKEKILKAEGVKNHQSDSVR